MEEGIKQYKADWSEWIKFPDPRKGECLYVPFGCGVYLLRNIRTKESVLFGKGKHLAQQYRTISFIDESEADSFEKEN